MAMKKRGKGKLGGGKGRPQGPKGRPGKPGKPGRPDGYPWDGTWPPPKAQQIPLAAAVDLTQRYRKSAPASEHGGFFWGDGIDRILRQPGCVGLRYYHGLAEDGSYEIVLVGVDKDGNDIVTVDSGGSYDKPEVRQTRAAAKRGPTQSTDAVILDTHFPCPPMCPWNSPL